jgi:hypothetical protein
LAKVFDQAPNETDQANGADTNDVGPEKPRRFRDIDVANHLVYGWEAALRYTPNGNCDQAGTTE